MAKSKDIPSRRNNIEYVDKHFKISSTINKLHHLMEEVTKDEVSARTVNAACNCISQINQIINTTISAAKFINSDER